MTSCYANKIVTEFDLGPYITVQDKMADIDSIWVLEGNLSYSLIKQLFFLNFLVII